MLQILDRLAGHAGFHRRGGNRRRYGRDQPWVERSRNDVILAILKHLPAIGFGDGVRHILACQHGDGLGSRDLHFLVDLAGTHIKCAAEDIGEAKDIVHLVRIV